MRDNRANQKPNDGPSIEERILKIRRVSTKRAGGSSFHFSVLSAAGDHNGNVGVALAKSKENTSAIRKSKEKARLKMFAVPLTEEGSIPHEIFIKNGPSILYLKPAPQGAGIIAGGSVRHILELAGVKNISAKVIGSNNQINNSYTLVKALQQLRVVKKKEDKQPEKKEDK